MRLQTHPNDPRLRRVRNLSVSLRIVIWVLAALVGAVLLVALVGKGTVSIEGFDGHPMTLEDYRDDLGWQHAVVLVFWLPMLGLGVAIFHQVERLLASYQRGVILDGGNARRITRIGLFIVVFCVMLVVGQALEAMLSASLRIPRNETLTFELPWFVAGLVIMAIGYAMGIACEVAEDAELTV